MKTLQQRPSMFTAIELGCMGLTNAYEQSPDPEQ
jgi:hypothetical protein